MSEATTEKTTEATAATPAPRDSQTCRLPDGRVLGFAEYGDPDGDPVLYFHGFPASRLEAAVADQAARNHRLRLLSLDRPGYGLSTMWPGKRCVVDWVDDVRAFAQQQQLTRFGVVGFSGGGPYALACACQLPAAMLTGVGIIAGAGPFDGSADTHIPRRAQITVRLLRRWPGALRLLLAAVLGSVRWLAHTGLATWWLERSLKRAASESTTETPAVQRKHLLRLLFETFAQGVDGTIQDGVALGDDFGFRFEDVGYDPVRFWNGDEDTNVPLAWVRPLIAKVPHAVLTVYEGKTHFSVLDHLDAMLGCLEVKEAESRQE